MQWATAGGLDVKSAGGLATWTVGGWRDRAMDGGLKRATDGGGLEGLAASRLEAIPLNSNAKYRPGWWAVTSKPNGETWTGINKKLFKKRTKQNEVSGRRLLFRSGLLSRCTQRGGTRSKLKITTFNKSKRARQGKAETDRNTGVITSRQDWTKLNRQQLKYPGNH